MSGGEQQMLTVARTLMGNPLLVLLDEPSEGVAPLIVEQMANTIVELKKQGLSILLSEQNIHFARAGLRPRLCAGERPNPLAAAPWRSSSTMWTCSAPISPFEIPSDAGFDHRMLCSAAARHQQMDPDMRRARLCGCQRQRSGYVLDEQVGFLLRVAMQRHTAIFMSRMIEA